jgi:hypothetical protein
MISQLSKWVGIVILGLTIAYVIALIISPNISIDLNTDNILNLNNICISIIIILCYPAFILGKMLGRDMTTPENNTKNDKHDMA